MPTKFRLDPDRVTCPLCAFGSGGQWRASMSLGSDELAAQRLITLVRHIQAEHPDPDRPLTLAVNGRAIDPVLLS